MFFLMKWHLHIILYLIRLNNLFSLNFLFSTLNRVIVFVWDFSKNPSEIIFKFKDSNEKQYF